MEQVYVKKTYVPKPVQKDRYQKGVFWIQSENPNHKQLWYKVVLKENENLVYCACEAYKYGKGQLCKHIFKVLQIDGGGRVV